MPIGIADFLEKVSKLKTSKEKVAALRANDTNPNKGLSPLRIILQGAFDPDVVWLLPPGEPPYTPNQLSDQQGVLIRDARKIRCFIKGFYPSMKPYKREALFIELLENVSPKDALLLCAINEKRLPWKGITLEHVKEAFPGLIKDVQPQKKEVVPQAV